MEIKKCQYAHDPSDTECANCNGLSIEFNGETYPATRCKGYIADMKAKFESVNITQESTKEIIENVVDDMPEVKQMPKAEYPINEDDLPFDMPYDDMKKEEKSEPKPPIPEPKPPVPYERKCEKVETPINNEGITTRITFKSGATISFNDNTLYYKFECTEERIITEDMDVKVEREKLWATVNDEIDKQLQEVIEMNKKS